MYPVQRFAIESIYCTPVQDRQATYKLIKITKPKLPSKNVVQMYNTLKPLPTKNEAYHVYTIGAVPPQLLNLLTQNREWYRDSWVNFQDDMTERNYIAQFYDDKGVNFLRSEVFYSFIDQRSMMIAIRLTNAPSRIFDIEAIKYMRIYSNTYFNSDTFGKLKDRIGIVCQNFIVNNNTDKVAVQNKLTEFERKGGKTMIYVNGLLTLNMTLNVPNASLVEIVYDQSIISKEQYPIKDLRTFISESDNKIKYLVYRNKIVDSIQYQDDLEFYVSTRNELVTKGLYLYRHSDHAVRNITDKDFSLVTDILINSANHLNNLFGGSQNDKQLIVFSRLSADNRQVCYSSLKLHELYKLPKSKQLDVLLGTNYGITEFRANKLENSDYFKIASANGVRHLNNEITTSALGYNGVSYFFGMNPIKIPVSETTTPVPELYQKDCFVYEYDVDGVLIGRYQDSGPVYTKRNNTACYLEFIPGKSITENRKLYSNSETIDLLQDEYRVLSAIFEGTYRLTKWEDITEDTTKVIREGRTIRINEIDSKKIKVVYMNDPLIYDLGIPTVDGVLYFPLEVTEDRGIGKVKYKLDIPYLNIDIYLNKKRLAYNIDYFIDYPYISICNKKYLDYTKTKQAIHIRCHGFTLQDSEINKHVTTGFVNNGALTRNNFYDIRDDRIYSVFVDGKLKDRKAVYYAEDSNTVRVDNPSNGLPYTLSEPFIPFKQVTGLDTLPYYKKNEDMNKKVSELYNLIFEEPKIDEFNVIADHHYLFSPTVSKIIHDMLDGNISASLYRSPYDESTIVKLIDDNYKLLMSMDPVKFKLPDNLTEIHPHSGNTVVALDLFQYRFITNVVKWIARNTGKEINLSGYLQVVMPEV